MKSGMTLCAIVVALAGVLPADRARAGDDDKHAVEVALSKFHEALNTLFTGDAGPMKDVWSHADDVSYMGPVGGFQIGWKQIEPYWDKQAAAKLGGKVDPKEIHITVSPQLAVAHYYEKGENVIAGKPQPVSIRTTTVFRKENGQWKTISHHTDTLAYLQK